MLTGVLVCHQAWAWRGRGGHRRAPTPCRCSPVLDFFRWASTSLRWSWWYIYSLKLATACEVRLPFVLPGEAAPDLHHRLSSQSFAVSKSLVRLSSSMQFSNPTSWMLLFSSIRASKWRMRSCFWWFWLLRITFSNTQRDECGVLCCRLSLIWSMSRSVGARSRGLLEVTFWNPCVEVRGDSRLLSPCLSGSSWLLAIVAVVAFRCRLWW